MMNIYFLAVITPPSIYRGCSTRICQGDKIWIYKEKPSGKAENTPNGHDSTQITILPYNFEPLLPASTQGNTDALSELINSKICTIRRNDTTGTVCTTTNQHTCGQIQ